MKPNSINILGRECDIIYKDNPAEVDVFKRESCFGQYDPWTRTIRIYDNGRKESDILQTLFHEILHVLSMDLKIKCFDSEEGHEDLDRVALAITDLLFRNNWLK